jgi:molecular chaperone GrpE
MQDCPPPGIAPDPASNGPETLTAEKIDSILADFRRWLLDIANAPVSDASEKRPTPHDFSLNDLVSQFVALRHDVSLQTKAARAQQEQASRSLEALEQALETLQDSTVTDGQSDDAVALALRPLLKSLLDVTDLMTLAGREVGRVREILNTHGTSLREQRNDITAIPAIGEHQSPAHEEQQQAARPTFLQRLFGRKPATVTSTQDQVQRALEGYRLRVTEELAERNEETDDAWTRIAQLVESILTGYNMSLERLNRTLTQFGLEPIPSEGCPFDPESMEVVDAVADTDFPSGEVVQEVRRGYLWRGRVFRFAQVKVAKGSH